MASRRRLCAYLSGGMEHAKNDGAGWRAEMEKFLHDELGHRAFNPSTASEKFLDSLGVKETFRAMKETDPDRYFSIVRRIVDGDSKEVTKRCDYVICLWDRSAARGAGTQGELTLARLMRKPVYLVSRIPFERIPGWVIGCSTKRFKSVAALRAFLRSHVS